MLEVVDTSARANFAIVAVGASAGGLEAFSQLLRHMPADTGMTFVFIQHLDPTHASLLAETLAKVTTMPVRQVEQGMRAEPGHVYVIVPNADLAIQSGLFVLTPRQSEGVRPHLPVDFFMRSLAAERGRRAIGVVLSGSASDGTDGLRAIQAEGGITFAQEPSSAKFGGMPQSALDAQVVDQHLGIAVLAATLARLSQHPYVQTREPERGESDADDRVREEILARVRSATGTDFSEFKPATVKRRLARRVALRGAADLTAYLALLDAEPNEILLLEEDVLIHVTAFFRDPDVFEALRTGVFPEILKHHTEGTPIRVWAAGCSSGEEVYSLAIALLEFLGESEVLHRVQIFGSDLSETAVQRARAGVYGDLAMRAVNDERRRRFFSKHEHGHRIHKRVREMCVFVQHDLVRDPPFSKLDLISCRNVLIYFDQALQKRVLPILHHCLSQPGFLLLGRSENIAGFSQLFSTFDKAHKIYARTANSGGKLSFGPRMNVDARASRAPELAVGLVDANGALVARYLDRLLLARYCPAAVLVKDNLDVLLFRGQTGAYLQAAPGQPQTNLIGMARGGLVAVLRETIAEAKRERVVVRRAGVEVDQGGSTKPCDVVVIPFSGLPEAAGPLFVVLFEEPAQSRAPARVVTAADAEVPCVAVAGLPDEREQQHRARLEHELASTKEYLHIVLEEQSRTNDELGASNEELVCGNEELQSTNEELETAKEELQSTNEELTTLNDELQRRNHEVSQVNTDLLNFSLTVDIAILTVDMERRVRRFTPKAHAAFNVSSSDVGRVIDDLSLSMAVPNLSQQVTDVIASGVVTESEVQALSGAWYRMQIRPYMTTDNQIEGAMISLTDINELKRLIADAQTARVQAEHANTAKDAFLATLSHELRTPLSSMLLNAERLCAGDLDQETTVRAGAALERAVRLQVKLIDDLLDISRIVAGKLTLECCALDLCALVQQLLDSMQPQFEAKQLALKVCLPPALAPIWGDPTRVQQVISNLLNNAIKFTPRLGQVTLVVDAADGYARVRVTDTGLGIEPSFLPHVFAHFSQSDTSITRKYGGLGLGLALVRHLVELHGGSVRAHSAGIGRGARFSVTFPVARATDVVDSDAAATLRRAHALDRPGKTKQYDGLTDVRVLFVEDDFRTREAVLEVLQFTGAQVALAASVADGLMAVDTFKPHVIICDIAMPGEDGYAFLRKLRAREAGRGTPIPTLALTALASAEDKRRALAAGFYAHLAKPIDIDRLRDAVLELAKVAATPAPAPSVQD